MQKPYTLIIPSWYPTDEQPLNGIFVQKHVEAISGFHNVIVMYVTGADTQRTQEKRISDSYVKYTHYYAESSSRGLNQLKYIWSQIKAYRYIVDKYGRPELLHLHVIFPAGMFVYLLLLLYNIPLIITEHWTGYTDEDGRYMKLPAIARRITEVLFSKAEKVSLVSEYFKQVILKKRLVDEKKLVTVYNTLNMPATKYHYTEDKAQKALYVGNLIDEQKNISVLINAVEIVAKTYPSFELTMVGGGSETDKFIKMAEDKGLHNKNIFFRGYVANSALTPIYQEHGFFILTSNFETFNIAAAEAMLSGLTVVSTRCGGPSEFVNEHTGIWIEHNTPADAAKAIIEMIARRSEFDSDRIARETQDKFGNETISAQLKQLYG